MNITTINGVVFPRINNEEVSRRAANQGVSGAAIVARALSLLIGR
jgi:hypothetical protein